MTEIPAHRRRVRPPAHAVTRVLNPATGEYEPVAPVVPSLAPAPPLPPNAPVVPPSGHDPDDSAPDDSAFPDANEAHHQED